MFVSVFQVRCFSSSPVLFWELAEKQCEMYLYLKDILNWAFLIQGIPLPLSKPCQSRCPWDKPRLGIMYHLAIFFALSSLRWTWFFFCKQSPIYYKWSGKLGCKVNFSRDNSFVIEGEFYCKLYTCPGFVHFSFW